jgi:DNA-binding transcriptional ArsR family regulator
LSDKRSKTTTDSIEETRLFHSRYLRAINSPLRRKILRLLDESPLTIDNLQEKLNMNKLNLKWHLDILEHGFCIEKQGEKDNLVYVITQEGKVVNLLDQT